MPAWTGSCAGDEQFEYALRIVSRLSDLIAQLRAERIGLEEAVHELNALTGDQESAGVPTSIGERSELKRHEHYKIFRDYLQHEDGLINQRLSWNFTIQGFLFATYGLCLQKLLDVSDRIFEKLLDPKTLTVSWNQVQSNLQQLTGYRALDILVNYVIPIVGFFVALFAFGGSLAAHRALSQLRADWN